MRRRSNIDRNGEPRRARVKHKGNVRRTYSATVEILGTDAARLTDCFEIVGAPIDRAPRSERVLPLRELEIVYEAA